MMTQEVPHLVCSVGTGNYTETVYALDDRTWASRFAPVALARLRDLRGGKASVLVTSGARDKWYPAVAAELAEAGLEPEAVDMPEGKTREEFLETFHRLVEAVGEGESVVLDVTFALRHLPFVYLAALTYLTAYRGVTIRGIYYGAFELPDPETGERPILDLTALFNLTEWFHAVQSARESGDLRPVAHSLRQEVARLFQERQGDHALSRAKDAIEDLAPALAAGLPVEVGLAAGRLHAAVETLAQQAGPQSVGRRSLGILSGPVASWATRPAPSKRDLPLSDEELQRQLALVQWYAERNALPTALLLLREWLVSLVVLRSSGPRQWLGRPQRLAAERQLGGMVQRVRSGVATATEQRLATVWDGVAQRRNRFAHAGMTEDEVRLTPGDVAEVGHLIQQCAALLADPDLPRLAQQRSRIMRLLVTPLGLSPGVLYSAVQHVRPDRVVVITSAEGRQRLPDALAAADVAGLPVVVRELRDPMTGFQEGRALLDGEFRRSLVEASEVVVNLTGGTTVIQYVVEQIAGAARSLGVAVRRVAVVDRRTPEEQRAHPFVLGELVVLDGTEAEQEEQEDGPTL
ncbi:MAG: TIGR02221 family CRISPR-associated protein [Chloroflexi bacterium]|nr:TIGR02221 family CRISPR-associated protein [Chloroflexota bacterium]